MDRSHWHLLSPWLHHSEGLRSASCLLSDYKLSLTRGSYDHVSGLLTGLLLLLDLWHPHTTLLHIALSRHLYTTLRHCPHQHRSTPCHWLPHCGPGSLRLRPRSSLLLRRHVILLLLGWSSDDGLLWLW